MQVKAKGASLTPAGAANESEYFDQDSGVIVQLVNSETAACWTSDFETDKKNTADQFKAKSP